MSKRLEELVKNGHVSVYRLTITNDVKSEQDTVKMQSHVYIRPYNPNVLVIPITNKAEILLVKHYRPSVDKDFWEFPGGAVEKGENLIQASSRELLEETGYASDDYKVLCNGYDRAGIVANTLAVVVASDVYQEDLPEKDLFIKEIRFFTIKQILDLKEPKMLYVDLFCKMLEYKI